jgi:hypothetical protein
VTACGRRSSQVGDRRSRIASRAGGSGGASAPRAPRCLVLLCLALLGGCRLQVDVNVQVAEDGGGSVEVVVAVDRDGIERIGGDLAAVLATDELAEAGWRIDGPHDEPDGFTRVRFRKAFDDPAEAGAVFDEIEGEDGPFQDFAVSHGSSFASREWGFSGTVDFGGDLSGLAGTELDGEEIGDTVEEVEAQLGEALSRIIQVRVGVRLPGEVTSNASTKAENGALWQVGFGDGTVEMEATGEEARTWRLVVGGLAVGAAVLLLVYGLVRAAGRSTAKRAGGPMDDDGRR